MESLGEREHEGEETADSDLLECRRDHSPRPDESFPLNSIVDESIGIGCNARTVEE